MHNEICEQPLGIIWMEMKSLVMAIRLFYQAMELALKKLKIVESFCKKRTKDAGPDFLKLNWCKISLP